MKYCTYCLHYWRGQPAYCSRCDRTFEHRICGSGHRSARDAQTCEICGSPHLSVPAPTDGKLATMARWIVYAAGSTTVGVVAFTITAGLLVPLDWSLLAPHLLMLLTMPWTLYRTTLVLPGRIVKARRPSSGSRRGWDNRA